MLDKPPQTPFFKQKLKLCSSLRCDQIKKCQIYDFGQTVILLKSNVVAQQVGLWVGFVEHEIQTKTAQQSVTKFIVIIVVTPKAAAKRELLFNKPGCAFF